MSISDYKVSIRPDYVLVERSKNYDVILGEMPAMLSELSAACEEAGCRKVLILGPKTKVNLDTMDLYDLGEQIARTHLQVAVVESHDASIDDESFLENVVFSRGGPLRFFTDEVAAKEWLEIS